MFLIIHMVRKHFPSRIWLPSVTYKNTVGYLFIITYMCVYTTDKQYFHSSYIFCIRNNINPISVILLCKIRNVHQLYLNISMLINKFQCLCLHKRSTVKSFAFMVLKIVTYVGNPSISEDVYLIEDKFLNFCIWKKDLENHILSAREKTNNILLYLWGFR